MSVLRPDFGGEGAEIIQFPIQEPLLTKPQLAKALQVSERWIELRVRDDQMPVLKMGRLRRFRLSEVEEWWRRRSA